MNEYIEIRFQRNDAPLRIRRQVPGGIELDEPDPIQRTVGIGFDGADDITKYRMRRIRTLQGWEPNQFKLSLGVEDGAIVLRGVNPHALPEGRYRVRVQLEEANTRSLTRTVQIVEDEHGVCEIEVVTDTREVMVDLSACDPAIRRVIDASSIDDQHAEPWLSGAWRPTRKACLLNVLATLRIRPLASAPLLSYVQHIFWVSNDRLYARVDRQLPGILETLSLDSRKPFYAEGRPTADVHLKLLDAIPELPATKKLFTPDGLRSFRAEGRPSLQAVIAQPPAGLAHTYAEFDLDLGNPLQDGAGFIVHMGELMDGKMTNHLDLRKDLAKTKAGDYLYYTLHTPAPRSLRRSRAHTRHHRTARRK